MLKAIAFGKELCSALFNNRLEVFLRSCPIFTRTSHIV